MGDSLDIVSRLGDGTMPGAYSANIRGRMLARARTGRRDARRRCSLRSARVHRSNGQPAIRRPDAVRPSRGAGASRR